MVSSLESTTSDSIVSIILDKATRKILLLKRADDIKHAGNVCLPGGYRDNTDNNAVGTAIRETFEETGIDLHTLNIADAELISNFETSYQHKVSAYYFLIESYPSILLSKESSEYFFIDLDFIRNKNHFIYNANAQKHFLSLQFHGYNIWGITATILFAFIDKIKYLKL